MPMLHGLLSIDGTSAIRFCMFKYFAFWLRLIRSHIFFSAFITILIISFTNRRISRKYPHEFLLKLKIDEIFLKFI